MKAKGKKLIRRIVRRASEPMSIMAAAAIFVVVFSGHIKGQEIASVVPGQFEKQFDSDSMNSTASSAGAGASVRKMTKAAAFQFADYTNIQAYISDRLEFPEGARLTGKSGMSKVRFEILASGEVGEIAILESPGADFDMVIRALFDEMPSWQPAMSDSLPMRTVHELWMQFTLR
jgi:hypothetical protein